MNLPIVLRSQFCFVLCKKVPLFSFEVLQEHRYLHSKGYGCDLICILSFNPPGQWGGGTFLQSTKRNDDVSIKGRFTRNKLHWY